MRWHGDVVPQPGDEIRFRTGRRYQVLGVRGRTLRVLVLKADDPGNPSGHLWTNCYWISSGRTPLRRKAC
jgi:hypothetical protein